MSAPLPGKGADITIRALQEGAFDFITKPEGVNAEENMDVLRQQFITNISNFALKRGYYGGRVLAPKTCIKSLRKHLPDTSKGILKEEMPPYPASIKAIVVGVSTGGPKALVDMLPVLSDKVDLPVFIVQHMPPTFTQSLARNLDTRCRHTVIESRHNDLVRNDHIYIAPGGKHMLLGRNMRGEVITVINGGPSDNGCRPAADVLFHSAAVVYGGDVVAIVLTGMGSDGTNGVRPLKRAGAYVIVQDEESSVVWGMPGSVANAGLADEILPLERIPNVVRSVVQKKGIG